MDAISSSTPLIDAAQKEMLTSLTQASVESGIINGTFSEMARTQGQNTLELPFAPMQEAARSMRDLTNQMLGLSGTIFHFVA